jgi:hypothetical protein
MSETIILLPSDVKCANKLAYARQASADLRGGRRSTRGAPRQPDLELQFNVIGARCELAGFLYLRPACDIGKLVWHQYTDDNPTDLPDLDNFIDVKGRTEGWHDLPVQSKVIDPPDWAYLLVRAHMHPKYEIVGWCWGHEAQQLPLSDPTGREWPAHWVKPGQHAFFKPPQLLFEELQRRHAVLSDQEYAEAEERDERIRNQREYEGD